MYTSFRASRDIPLRTPLRIPLYIFRRAVHRILRSTFHPTLPRALDRRFIPAVPLLHLPRMSACFPAHIRWRNPLHNPRTNSTEHSSWRIPPNIPSRKSPRDPFRSSPGNLLHYVPYTPPFIRTCIRPDIRPHIFHCTYPAAQEPLHICHPTYSIAHSTAHSIESSIAHSIAHSTAYSS